MNLLRNIPTRITVCVVATIGLAGCMTISPPQTETISLGTQKKQVYAIPLAVAEEHLSTSKIYAAYASAAIKNSSVSPYRSAEMISQGVRASASDRGVLVEYVRTFNDEHMKNVYSGTFEISKSTVGGTHVVNVNCPASLSSLYYLVSNKDPTHSYGPTPWPGVVTKDQAIADINKICRETSLTFPVVEYGEVDTPFSDTAVFANFARKLRSFQPSDAIKQYDIGKSQWFSVEDNGKTYGISVSVFPYRSGSKVSYRVPYVINCMANSKCDYDVSLASRIRQVVTKIAND